MTNKNNPKFQSHLLRSKSMENAPIKEGHIYTTTDKGETFIDITETDRVVLGDFQFVNDLDDLNAVVKPMKKIYFCLANNTGYYHDGTKWLNVINYSNQWRTLQ